ncbi:MAG: response regulator transcription factor [Omnitrophica WOR_2 bacterium]
MNKLKIVLADDHLVVREGLRLLINSQPDMEVVGEAGDGQSALTKALDLQPQVVVMDLSMPELSGIIATRRLKEKAPKIQVLALTVHEDKSYLRELLQAGASGYVLKRSAGNELINAIHVVAGGGVYLDPLLVGPLIGKAPPNPSVESETPENVLSLRESEVARLIAKGYSNREIADQINVSVKTVETYKYRVMEKLHFKSRADIVRYALKHGWLQENV